MKISILLPYKENYNKKNAGAVSLFVNDICKKSKFKKDITIFGSTESKLLLSKNYINLLVNDSIFKSSNNSYVKCFLEKANLKKIDILEIHNRPSYIKLIRNSYKNKLFFYFHNDPLSMMGSKQLEERKKVTRVLKQKTVKAETTKSMQITGIHQSQRIVMSGKQRLTLPSKLTLWI